MRKVVVLAEAASDIEEARDFYDKQEPGIGDYCADSLLAATTIAAIYKERWQIELFFKLLKQQLKIKTFVGTSANAVRIQIWTALISVLVLRYLQFRSAWSGALSNLVALLRWNLFSYRDLWTWLSRPLDTPPELPDQQLVLDSILPKTGQPAFQN